MSENLRAESFVFAHDMVLLVSSDHNLVHAVVCRESAPPSLKLWFSAENGESLPLDGEWVAAPSEGVYVSWFFCMGDGKIEHEITK